MTNILGGYATQPQFARDNQITERTVARYRAQGLPWVPFGGKVLIPIEEARLWLESRMRREGKAA